ncbi:MAG TPA: outer membrane lipoprotein carrier protein LolA [Polyangiaceae bacterium]|jgi:outer membrane lipoprotein-sorting protein
MKRATVLAAALVTLAAPARAQPGNLSVGQAVSNVQNFYDHVTTYNATFRQHYVMRLLNTSMDSDGAVTFAKPGKMNFSYFHPPGNRVIVNGQNVWVHQASTNQSFAGQAQVPAALSFLTGAGHFSSTFHFVFVPALAFPGGYVLEGTPVTPTSQMTKALFYVDAQTSQIRRVTLVDAQGNHNQFDFTNVTINTAVSPRSFQP